MVSSLRLGLVLLVGCSAAPPRPVQIAAEPVTLEIQVDGGKATKPSWLTVLPMGCTVEDVMIRAAEQGLDVDISGSGTTAFVSAIDGESGSGTKGWLFKVDGEFSERGIGTTELDPPATITWVFDDISATMAE